jgi:type VI secretion system protein
MFKAPEPAQQVPAPVTPDGGIPDNWDEATGMFKAPEPAPPATPKPPPAADPPPPAATPTPPPAAAPAPAGPAAPVAPADASSAMALFASGAGLKPEQLNKVDQGMFFQNLGQMFRAYSEGIMRTLGGRASVRKAFRLNQTMIAPSENNPLKFSPLVGDAMTRLLLGHDQAYMDGVDAIKEGFNDLDAHQIAVIAGMEAALKGILDRFSPEALEKRMVSHSVLDNILPGARKAKYWDIFNMLYNEIANDAEDDFQKLFDDAFTDAYEDQLSRVHKDQREN